jgi:hypothetical protein
MIGAIVHVPAPFDITPAPRARARFVRFTITRIHIPPRAEPHRVARPRAVATRDARCA